MNWKPVKNDDGYCFVGIPSGNIISFSIRSEPKRVKSVLVWLTTQEAEEFAKGLLDEVYRNKRIQGIRNAALTFRWF